MFGFLRFLFGLLGVAMLVAAISMSLWLKWGHIDMTDRRLLIEFPGYTFLSVVWFIGGLVFLGAAGVDLRSRD